MDRFEHELKARLERREPSTDFTARVMERVRAQAEEPAEAAPIEFPARPRRRPAVFRWAAAGAMAASLAFGALAVRHQRAERRAAEHAEAQLMESLSVAGSKVSQARDKVWGAPRGD
jgi:hypothetical protein